MGRQEAGRQAGTLGRRGEESVRRNRQAGRCRNMREEVSGGGENEIVRRGEGKKSKMGEAEFYRSWEAGAKKGEGRGEGGEISRQLGGGKKGESGNEVGRL